ncbi:hypothetical protein BDV26DRAFT_278948 [Aspergillus bertholletiae]|uniref:Uncharacterized protein n=2 Tax=Aspergillus subgen. Circumdati TaxID=2720871 RepID=A0A5N7BHE4_9EURO|nr:hypothetical protein BDV26DRAFT_278948 [Aspergillus bertholletiae]
MSPQIILGHCFFSQEDVQLASLIPNINDIDLDTLESVLPVQTTDYTVRKLEDVTTAIRATNSSKFQAFLSRVASWDSQRSAHANLDLTAQKGRVYTLKKPTQWFRRLCEREEVRRWLQEQIEYENEVHFVIGLYTLFDAAASDDLERSSNHSGTISAPISAIAGLPPSHPANIGVSAGHEGARGTTHRCTAPGEQIFAIRLKKVKYRAWYPHDVNDAHLAKHSHWTMASDNRSAADEHSEMVAVFLDESTDENEEAMAPGFVEFHVLSESLVARPEGQ